MNGLCLFAGICGIELGLKSVIPDFRTVCYVENDRYAQGVIMSRIRSGELDDAPIWDDVRTFDGRPWRGCVDIITGGFPCQDMSSAGKQRGLRAERSGLWSEYKRLICEIRPRFTFVENVPELIIEYGYDFLADLAEIGYNAEWVIIQAAHAGAQHERERCFILAYADKKNDTQHVGYGGIYGNSKEEKKIWNPYRIKFGMDIGEVAPSKWQQEGCDSFTESTLIRNVNGIQNTLDRLGCCGNAVVPQQAAKAWEILYSRIA